VNLTEAQDLARRAQASGVRSFVGLQARFSPILAQARALIGDGFIGRVLATNLSGSGMAWGEETNPAHAYIFDREAGANVLSAPLMHAVDAISFVLGEFKLVASVAAVRRPVVRISGTDASIDVTAPDHAAVAARLCSGAVAAVSYRGATSRAGNLRWEINGAEGDLLITADDGNIQVADLTLSGGRASDALTPLHPDGGVGLAANLYRLYAAIARDLRAGSHEVPDFQHALKRHELLNAIEQGGTA
jgi:predicted dehydrogenase